jgi:hypothetical protein
MKNPCGLPAAGAVKTGLKKLAKNARYHRDYAGGPTVSVLEITFLPIGAAVTFGQL